MANVTFKKDSKGNINKAIVSDVVFYYTSVQKPRPIYEQRDWSNPNKFEYLVDVVVDEDTADILEETFPKGSYKKFSKEKFMERFKIEDESELPFDAKKYFVAKFKQAAQKKDGEPISPQLRPRVFEMVDGKPVDVTVDKLVGNGSKGDILLRVGSNDYGTFAYLSMIKVIDMVEYEQTSSNGIDEDSMDFLGGEVELADTSENDKQPVKKDNYSEESEDEEFDEIPFDADEFE